MADQDWFAQNAPGQPQQPAAAQPPAEAQQPAPTQAVTQPAQNTQNDDWFAANAPASATPPTQPGDTTPSKQKEDTRSMWEKIKSAVAGPNTALSTPLGQTPSQEISGVNDIIHGEFAKGGHKIWDAEKIGAHNVVPGSPVEWAIRQFNPDFHGTATKEYIAADKAKNPNPGEKPLIDISQFLDKKEHPIAKAIAEVGEGFTSPNNLAIMYSTGGLGLIGKTPQALKAFKVTQKLISAGFAYQALNSAYTHSEAFKDAMDNGDEAEAEYQLTHALAGGTIALQAGSHAAEGVNVPGTKITPI